MQGEPSASVPVFVVDAFAEAPFRGNPAGVCLLPGFPDDPTLLAIARELNLSETAFAVHPAPGGGDIPLRWFTPEREMPICGHATLATAKVLLDECGAGADPLSFQTLSGRLTVSRRGAGLALDFPADTPVAAPAPPGLLAALGVREARACFRGERTGKWVLRLGSAREVLDLAPDCHALRRLEAPGLCGVAVTAAGGGGGCHCVSRYFNPWAGVDEDPVTGSVHTLLGPYWSRELGRDDLLARQASRRGGILRIQVRPGEGRVVLAGDAFVVLRGRLDLGRPGPGAGPGRSCESA